MDGIGHLARGAGRGKIIDLMVRRRGQIQVTGLNTLRAYWEALRQDGDLPRRSQIDPRGIESALDIAFLAERVAPRVARFRLAGRQISDLMGMEVRGMPLSALIAPEARDSFGEALARAFAGPAVVEMSLRSGAGLTQPRLEARMLLLPLRADDGSVTRLLGGLAREGRLGFPPRRLDITGVQITALEGAAAGTPDVPAADRPRIPGFAEPPAGFAGPPRGRPQLRVIRNDD